MIARQALRRAVAIIAALFGAATIVSGGRALFGGVEAREAVGNAVLFVLWFNFLAGFAYLAASLPLWTGHRAAVPLAWAIGLATLAVFVVFGIAVWSGVAYEMRTVGAMTLRTVFWFAVAVALSRYHRR
jgi:hypothetical protein